MMTPEQILKCVTVTGADDTIDPGELVKLQEDFPYAEFGILLSNRFSLADGANRFPSRNWLRELNKMAQKHKLNLSGHLCGRWVQDALCGDRLKGLGEFQPDTMFKRWQYNTHGQPHLIVENKLAESLLGLEVYGQTVIFQLDNVSGTKAAEIAVKQGHNNIAGLFDLSHGAGILPEDWPKPLPGLTCGFAGGLSPKNVEHQLFLIQEVAEEGCWIDAETYLRGDLKDNFCKYKVAAFLEAAKPWVIV